MLSSPFSPDRRHRALLLICLLTSFMLLGLSIRVFAACFSLNTGTEPGWTHTYTMFVTQEAAFSYCSSLSSSVGQSPCSYDICTQNPDYYVCWANDFNNNSRHFAYACLNSGGNDDSDGDGIFDYEDPCPNNPDLNCKDPNDPSDLPSTPEFPDEIAIGDCVIDISEITSIFKAEGGVFPINWIVAFGSALRAFTQVQASEAPSIQYSFSFFGKSYEIDLHLERFNSIASYIRFVSGFLAMFYFIRFANRGFFKVITGSGT